MSAEGNTRAVGYIRVATGSQRRREESIDIQRQAILGYAKKTDTRIVRLFADHDCIADIAMRQGLSDAMEYIAKGKASVLVVADLARLTRSIEDLFGFVERYRFLNGGPALISVNERVDTRTADGRLLLSTADLLVWFDSSESARRA